MNKLMKSLGCTALFGVFASLAFAQSTTPDAQVIDGDLYTTDDPPVLIAEAPAGTVTQDGSLDLGGGNVIAQPTASILDDGSLDLNSNGVFDEGVDIAVPSIPVLLWMGLADQAPASSNADGDWYYSDNFKFVFHWKNYDTATGGWFFIEELSSNFFVFSNPANSPSTGFFAFTFTWDSRNPGQTAGVALDDPQRGTAADPSTFVYFFPSNGVTLNVPSSSDTLAAWIWLFSPHSDTGGTTPASHFFREWPDGNFLTRFNGNAIKLSAPVGGSN